MTTRKIDENKVGDIRRKKLADDTEETKKPPAVTAGSIGEKIADYAFNASREKILEMTDLNPMQAKLLPQLRIVDSVWGNVLEIAYYRQDEDRYKKTFRQAEPVLPPIIDDFIYYTAQAQKSLHGTNLKSAIDLALAEMETKAGEEGDILGGFGDEDQ